MNYWEIPKSLLTCNGHQIFRQRKKCFTYFNSKEIFSTENWLFSHFQYYHHQWNFCKISAIKIVCNCNDFYNFEKCFWLLREAFQFENSKRIEKTHYARSFLFVPWRLKYRKSWDHRREISWQKQFSKLFEFQFVNSSREKWNFMNACLNWPISFIHNSSSFRLSNNFQI